MSLAKAFCDVRDFHLTFGHPAPRVPTLQSADRAHKRGGWIVDEVNELREASTLVDQADAYIDIIYFAVGGLVELGINPSPLWDIVHLANMAKRQPDGTVLRREDGKIIKPEGWTPPDVALSVEVEQQIALADWNS